jgi:GDP-4-dehydro-6-deoxy-D-mannose reductase
MTGRALITGASGFVGPVLRARLEGHGWETLCCGQAGEGGLTPCDVTNPAQVAEVVASGGPFTHVFHLAAMTFVPTAHNDPSGAMAVNLLGTIHLTNVLRALQPAPRLLFIGSAESYGAPAHLPMTEEHPLQPGNPYAISKAAADHYCAYLSRTTPLDIVRVRPFNHSGAGQSDRFVLSSFARQVAEMEAGLRPEELHVGNLDAQRDFLHVADVVAAYEALALRGRPGEAYNVSSGKARAVREALDALLGLTSARPRILPDPARMRPADVPVMYGSHDKISADTGWAPTRGLVDILQDLLDYWRNELAARPAP